MAFDRSKISMKKVQPPQQIKFTPRVVVCGELLGIEKIRLRDGGIAARYIMRDMETGQKFQFLGTTQIDQMLGPEDAGHYLEIAYLGEDTNVERNGRKMRVFEIAKSEFPVNPRAAAGRQLEDGTYITDQDIPF